eukprot:9115061-Ditylum_brightwellii.AAC.1
MRRSCKAWLRSLSHNTNIVTDEDDKNYASVGDDSSDILSRLDVPVPAFSIKGEPIGGEAIMRIIADPDTTLTSSLHIGLITLLPGTKMRPRESKGVEVYYILQGTGTLWSDGNDDYCMSNGDVVVVNPWSVRYMSNKGWEVLSFLRIADGGTAYKEEGYDI